MPHARLGSTAPGSMAYMLVPTFVTLSIIWGLWMAEQSTTQHCVRPVRPSEAQSTCFSSVVIRLNSSIDSPFPFSSLLLGAYKIQIPSTLTMTPCPPALICIAPARNPFLATHTILWSALNYGRLQRGILSRLMQGLDTGSVLWSMS